MVFCMLCIYCMLCNLYNTYGTQFGYGYKEGREGLSCCCHTNSNSEIVLKKMIPGSEVS